MDVKANETDASSLPGGATIFRAAGGASPGSKAPLGTSVEDPAGAPGRGGSLLGCEQAPTSPVTANSPNHLNGPHDLAGAGLQSARDAASLLRARL